MADAFARVSGQIGVVTAQNGPAATLLVPPLAEALKGLHPDFGPGAGGGPGPDRQERLSGVRPHGPVRVPAPSGCAVWTRPRGWMTIWTWPSGRPPADGPARWPCSCPRTCSWPSPAEDGAGEARQQESGRLPPGAHHARARTCWQTGGRAAGQGPTSPVIIAGGGVHLSGASSGAGKALQEAAGLARGPPRSWARARWTSAIPLSLGVVGYFMGSGGIATKFQRELVSEADVIHAHRQPHQPERHRLLVPLPHRRPNTFTSGRGPHGDRAQLRGPAPYWATQALVLGRAHCKVMRGHAT